MIDVQDGQRVENARAELTALGVTEIAGDRLRQVGRGVRDKRPDLSQLCGECARGKVAVAPDGSVWPCVFARWMPVGSVREYPLAKILSGVKMESAAATLERQFAARPKMGKNPCDPQCWPTGTGPCGPRGGCQPNYG